MTNNSWFPKILLGAYVLVFIYLAINPFSRDVWFAENLPIVLIVLYLIFLYWRGVQFSNTSYALMSVLIFMHTVGGHFTFERVPFDWFNNFFGFERNMYDRVAHFSVGFYAYPIAEYLNVRKLANTKWLVYLTPLFFIISIAAIYEMIEWWFAATYGGEAGAAFLGSQGDIWDAQKDMLMDTLGGVTALVLFYIKSNCQWICNCSIKENK
jgi:putative membrane protein